MTELLTCKENLLALAALYHKKYELSKEVGPDYYDLALEYLTNRVI